jgi:hypothetical protein
MDASVPTTETRTPAPDEQQKRRWRPLLLYLVTTGWRDEASHGRYARDDVPALCHRAGAPDDLLQIRGHAVALAGNWVVSGR